MLDIIEITSPGRIAQRETGLYVSARYGRITWQDSGQACQDTGATVHLMDGPKVLATSEILLHGSAPARDWWEQQATAIEPWARTLRSLAQLPAVREQVCSLRHSRQAMRDEFGDMYLDEQIPAIQKHATAQDYQAADGQTPAALGLPAGCREAAQRWAAIADHAIRRLNRTIGAYQRVALAMAPDLETHGDLEDWDLPPRNFREKRKSIAVLIAEELLAGWAVVSAERDPLVQWAVRSAGLQKTRAHEITGLSRATIDRIIPPSPTPARP